MRLTVDASQFPFVKMAYEGVSGPIDWSTAKDDSYFEAMREQAKRGRFGAVLDLRSLDSASMPGAQERRYIYDHAAEFYKEHAAKVVAVAMVYNSRMMEMLSTGVGWARGDSPRDSRRSFTDMKAAEDWVRQKLFAEGVRARRSGS
jgi:hypothetical protein